MAFDSRGADFAGFLAKVNGAVWEARALDAALATHYHPQVILRDAGGLGFGPAGIGADVLGQIAAFPDLSLRIEDVMWSGGAQVGMLGSERAMGFARHRGGGLYGAPSGAPVRFRVMADRYAKAERISDVWQVRDTGAILRQIGVDPRVWAGEQLARLDPETQPFTPARDVQGPYTGTGTANQWCMAFSELLERVMLGGFSAIPEQYDRACALHYAGGEPGFGPESAEAFWLGLRASFPSADFAVHHRIGIEEPLLPPRAALRWSLTGRHDGWGLFGAPTGAEVHVMGLSHAEFGPRGLRREWSLIDESAIWMQIAAKTG
ncbi:ester cyclase [Cognatishimia sp. F0-27]|uniref:nuclear transport factor 2 family protein n=1 Tax=Cognatishimia sp. F0-27 TaxID=2816855 RepID=UPI001D0CD898|nr:ester cyclase [Cognatishimia sp. F0-27]